MPQQDATSYYSMTITILAGLALFLYGMKLMSDGLQLAAGNRMKSILRFFGGNRVVGILSGAVVTALVQSSSVSTVMVIGFVNAGLLNLVQSMGIIFGANIGTTITAQIVAFKIDWVIFPAIILGTIMIFVSYRGIRGWGEAILGFGMLFFGMTMMSTTLKSLSTDPEFLKFFSLFDCAPVDGMLPVGRAFGALAVGLVVTMIIQSSSAVTGVVVALGGSGLINLYTAMLLVLGSNIGTTVTAQLASLATNRVAKQAAMAHTLFNVIGVAVIMASFWLLVDSNGIPWFFRLIDALSEGGTHENLPRQIANSHTLFNVVTTIMLTPFIPQLAHVCEKIIPISGDEVEFTFLEPHLLEAPVLALRQCVAALQIMLRDSWGMVVDVVNDQFIPGRYDEDVRESLQAREEKTDRAQLEITNYLTRLMQDDLAPRYAAMIPKLMHCTNDAERIGDHTLNILELARRIHDCERDFSETAINEYKQMMAELTAMAEKTIALTSKFEPGLLGEIIELNDKIALMANEYEENHISRLRQQLCSPDVGVIFIEALAVLVKVSDRLVNIAERADALAREGLAI
ncbi:MAG: Na/Pi cotransporter family protein [Lentisphaerae bacterium]|nr:Na/Pi cotransporter family protein [Lentisphaerota bacterium]